MQILKMIGYAAGSSVVVGLLLGGVFELVRVVQLSIPRTVPEFSQTDNRKAKI